jgi:hypothetical protein
LNGIGHSVDVHVMHDDLLDQAIDWLRPRDEA